jgi:hypothetical protein
MGWQAIRIPSSASEEFAQRLLHIANDPATWSFSNLGAMIFRSKTEDGEQFYFSPQAVLLFKPLIAEHQGFPADPPLGSQLLRSQSSQIALGFKTRWDTFKRKPRSRTAGVKRGVRGKP